MLQPNILDKENWWEDTFSCPIYLLLLLNSAAIKMWLHKETFTTNSIKYISRSAHQTPNFTNPKYFVCLLFEDFFQIKVLN